MHLFFFFRANGQDSGKKSPHSENSGDSEMEEDLFENSMTESPSPEEDKPRDLSSKRDTRPIFGTLDAMQLESLRLLMNPTLSPAFNSYLNPATVLNFQKNIAAQPSTTAQSTPTTAVSSAPKRSKLMIDEILKLKPETSDTSTVSAAASTTASATATTTATTSTTTTATTAVKDSNNQENRNSQEAIIAADTTAAVTAAAAVTTATTNYAATTTGELFRKASNTETVDDVRKESSVSPSL